MHLFNLDDQDLEALGSILEDFTAMTTYDGTVLHGRVELADAWTAR